MSPNYIFLFFIHHQN